MSNRIARRFRKKPVEIEAMKWTEKTTMSALIEFTNHLVRLNDVNEEFFVFDRLHNTWVKFQYGDWIICGLQGEFYPCNPEVFENSYDEVNPDLVCDAPDTTAMLDGPIAG